MIALGDGVTSDSEVDTKQQYLARVGNAYFVVMPVGWKAKDIVSKKRFIKYQDVSFCSNLISFAWHQIDELAPIY